MKQQNNELWIKDKTSERIKGFTYLLLSIMIVMFFVFVLAPGIDNVPRVKPLINFIDEHQIDAGALYYTDIEEFSVAEMNIKTTLNYPPCITTEEKSLKINSSSKNK